jgi:acyl carrier protein
MTIDEVRGHIESSLNRILGQKGLDKIHLQDDMRLLGGDMQIDSLDLAALITEIEEVTKKDPFKAGFRNFRTVGELARMYAE